MHRSSERGQVLPLLAALVVLAAAVALVVAELGAAAVQRARARTAADAAALAGAAAGELAARAAAEANDADLVEYRSQGRLVAVVVRFGDARAQATAEGVPALPGGVPAGTAPATAAALARAAQLLGRPVPVVDLSADGRSVTVDPGALADVERVAADAGLCRQAPSARPVHFAACLPSPPG